MKSILIGIISVSMTVVLFFMINFSVLAALGEEKPSDFKPYSVLLETFIPEKAILAENFNIKGNTFSKTSNLEDYKNFSRQGVNFVVFCFPRGVGEEKPLELNYYTKLLLKNGSEHVMLWTETVTLPKEQLTKWGKYQPSNFHIDTLGVKVDMEYVCTNKYSMILMSFSFLLAICLTKTIIAGLKSFTKKRTPS